MRETLVGFVIPGVHNHVSTCTKHIRIKTSNIQFQRRLNPAHTVPKADPHARVSTCPPGNRDYISVLQKEPLLVATERQLRVAVAVLLQQATLAADFCSADGAGAEQVADVHRTTRDGVVGEHLRERPEEVAGVCLGDGCGGSARGCEDTSIVRIMIEERAGEDAWVMQQVETTHWLDLLLAQYHTQYLVSPPPDSSTVSSYAASPLL